MDVTRKKLVQFLAAHNEHFCVVKSSAYENLLDDNKDIDLVTCLETKDVLENLQRLGLQVKIFRYYNRDAIFVIYPKGRLIKIDIIKSFSRKQRCLRLDWNFVRRNSSLDNGIRFANDVVTFSYAQMFYTLNGVDIPKKYIDVNVQVIPHQWSGRALLLYILYLPKSFVNRWFLSKAISFSGPDGSGKTSVIEEISKMVTSCLGLKLEYKRHRPFIFPILSRLKGREQAIVSGLHSDIRAKVPATGLSMYLRYLYYLIDFLLGQFVIGLKRRISGKIIIYDRYYYDFICDPERTNIARNRVFARLYELLIRDLDLNIFIRVNADVALKRKKELTRADYIELSDRYEAFWVDKGLTIVDNDGKFVSTINSIHQHIFNLL